MHPLFGFMPLRLQTWFPFGLQVCLNGGEWRAQQRDAAGLAYRRQGNSFPWVKDFARAQRLMDAQLRVNGPKRLAELVREWHPAHAEVLERFGLSYYWSVRASAWPTDLVFRDPARVRRLYPRLVHYSLTSFGSREVLLSGSHGSAQRGVSREKSSATFRRARRAFGQAPSQPEFGQTLR
jgi:hypothetical protein